MSALLNTEFPESLPVSTRRDEIMAVVDKHQGIIVCGETGSGKTTLLSKIALARMFSTRLSAARQYSKIHFCQAVLLRGDIG